MIPKETYREALSILMAGNLVPYNEKANAQKTLETLVEISEHVQRLGHIVIINNEDRMMYQLKLPSGKVIDIDYTELREL